ncbi:putative metallophosphoesterase [Platanthera zijinensis]|uniref:Metallophosphoesterase n=1 Tax=Platanthera zijinensis TaxID=2320716 RepID=A0AAP0B7R7_9ASPA
MRIGLRGPSNLFGHPTSKRIAAAEAALQYWNPHPGPITKIVFGHFPMSFTASSEKGKRYESLFANQSISAYICGHLHATFGKQLWRLHEFKHERANQFWEWELGDWKDSRFIRIISIDRGEVSFLDIELPVRTGPQDEFQAILITYPIDSRLNNRVEQHNQPLRNDISALVFSARSIINVTAKIFDSSSGFMIIEEILMQPASNQSITKPLFHAKWDVENYKSVSAARYWLQIFALDSAGNTIASDRRPISVEGRTSDFSPTWMVYLIFYLQWENIYSILLWSNICFNIVLLCLPKLLNLFKENDVLYLAQRNLLSKLLLFLIEGSRSKKIWSAMVIYLLYLLFLPWFWGFGTSQNGDISEAYLFGWRTNISGSDERIGAPDLITISLPFMYLVIAPLFLAVYSLYTERSAAYLHISRKTYCPAMKAASVPEESGPLLESYNGDWIFRLHNLQWLVKEGSPVCCCSHCLHSSKASCYYNACLRNEARGLVSCGVMRAVAAADCSHLVYTTCGRFWSPPLRPQLREFPFIMPAHNC